MTQLFANNAASELASAVTSGDVSLTLKTGDGTKFPTPSGGDFFLVTLYQKAGQDEINHEIVKCTARAGDVLTVVRAQEGTTARSFATGDPVELRLTAGSMSAKQDTLVSGTSIKTINGTSVLGSGNITAGDVTLAGVQTLTNKTLTSPISTGNIYNNGAVRGNITAVAALDINCSIGNYFTKTINGASTFTFSNAPAARAYAFTLELTHTSGAVTWPASVQWPGGSAPSLAAGKTHIFVFVTDDGGTRWRGVANVNYTN